MKILLLLVIVSACSRLPVNKKCYKPEEQFTAVNDAGEKLYCY